jgi:addiction module HigA family antidote
LALEFDMKKQHVTPIHPGEVLRDELENLNLTQSALAHHIGVLPKTINEICRGRRGISAEMSLYSFVPNKPRLLDI